jgi:hypothetical protein
MKTELALAWAKTVIGEKVQRTDVIKDEPWSQVTRITTPNQLLYLKITPPMLAREAPITQFLHDRCGAPTPTIQAYNPDLDCFLMRDAGNPLRDKLKQQFQVDLLAQAINLFSSLQQKAMSQVDQLITLGVPDWRPQRLPDLLNELLLKRDLLAADGLSETERQTCLDAMPLFSTLCEELTGYGIAPSIVQPDFHDNNILINKKNQLTFIDLGEITISHPLFSLAACLWQCQKHHGLQPTDQHYQTLKTAGLSLQQTNLSRSELNTAFDCAQTVGIGYSALCQHFLFEACGVDAILTLQRNKLKETLCFLSTQLKKYKH